MNVQMAMLLGLACGVATLWGYARGIHVGKREAWRYLTERCQKCGMPGFEGDR